jgi:hypothetical protein
MANEAQNMSLKVGETVPPFKELFGLEPKNIWNLHLFGEVGIAKKGPDIQSKMANPGIAVLYLGHLKDHGQEVYCLFNLDTKRGVLSQDVHWLDQKYVNYEKSKEVYDPDDVSDEEQDDGVNEANNNEEQQTATNAMTKNNNNHVSWADVTQRTTRSVIKAGATLDNLGQTSKPNAKLVRQIACLTGTGIYTNPVAEKVLDEAQQQEQALDEHLPPENEDTGEQDMENAQLGRDSASFVMDKTLDQLFGNFAFFVCETMMESSNDQDIELENAPIMDKNKTKLMTEVNNLKKHIIDLLDKAIRNDNKMAELDHLIKMKHIILKLKDDIPEAFQQAYNHPDEKIRTKWREGINKELIKCGVWRNMKRNNVPSGRQCVKNRWVFEIKQN